MPNPYIIKRVFGFLLLCIAAQLALPLIGAASPQNKKNKKPGLPASYLLLVNTAIASMLDAPKLKQFDKSPYDGLAVAFLHAYDTSAVPSADSMDAKISEWRGYTSKEIWPWLYLNRMIGFSVVEKNAHADVPYFRNISGLDLDNKNGARADFLKIWRNSLAAARDSGAPGVVCDLEFYNFYKAYDIGELARATGKKPAEAADSLRKLGAEMADIANETFPEAILWFLFTGFTHAGYKTLEGTPYYPSPTYVAMGLLDEISQKHFRAKVLTGGEGSLAYCHETLQDFRSAIVKRRSDLDATLRKYQGTLEMAGTMTVWSDRASARGWVNEGTCKEATAASVEELQPYLELLMRTYRYNWIYGSADGNYLAFSPQSAPRFDAVIAKAKERASTAGPIN